MFNGEGITHMSSIALSPQYDGVSLYERMSYNGRLVAVIHILHEEDKNSGKVLEKSSVEGEVPLRFQHITEIFSNEKETLLDIPADFNNYEEYTEILFKEDSPPIILEGER